MYKTSATHNCDSNYSCPLDFLNMFLCWITWQANERQWTSWVGAVNCTSAHPSCVEMITMQARYSIYSTTLGYLLNPFKSSTTTPELMFHQLLLAVFIKIVPRPGRCIYMSCHTSDCRVDLTHKGFTLKLVLTSWGAAAEKGHYREGSIY